MISRRLFTFGGLCLPLSARESDMQTATRFYKTTKTELSPVAPPVSPMISWAPQLVFPKGFFAYNAPIYDMRLPGLYAFTNYANANTTHMIVYDNDPIALLSAAAWLSSFGDGDNGLSAASLSVKARTSVLSILCGTLHPWASSQLLTPQGVPNRRVHFLAMDAWNYVVDGHEAIEVTIGGQRVLADLSNNCLFLDSGGNRLSANGAVAAIAGNSFTYELLADDAPYVSESNGGFDATAYARRELGNDTDRRAWHRKIFQAIGMWNGNELWWKLPAGSTITAAQVEALQPGTYKVKSAALWDAAFYP